MLSPVRHKITDSGGQFNAGSGLQSQETMDRIKLSAVKLEKLLANGEFEMGSGSIFTFYRWPCILTNNHVCASGEEALAITVELKDLLGNITKAPLDPQIYFLTHARLDFTIVALAWRPRMGNGKGFPGAWDYLQIIKNHLPEVKEGCIISIWQHAEGGDKANSVGVVNKAMAGNDNYISYEADTFGGSSGSLVTVAGKPQAIHVGVLKGGQGNFGLKLSSILEEVQMTPRRRELTDDQAFSQVNKPDIPCKPRKPKHSINDDQVVKESKPQRRPTLTKREIKKAFFNFWQERIKWIAIVYILLICSGLGFVAQYFYFKDERTCQADYGMSCADLRIANAECQLLYGADCRTANQLCRDSYGGTDCASSYIACQEVWGEDCPTANPKCLADWGMTCVASNTLTKENYEGLTYPQLVNQTAEAMNSTSVENTIYYQGVSEYIWYSWGTGSAIRKLWKAYPDKQCWMSNQNYTINPTTDEFVSEQRGTARLNQVYKKTSVRRDGFSLLAETERIDFYYYTNNRRNGPQRTFSGDNGYVLEFYWENDSQCGDETHFYLNDTSAIIKTYDPCKTDW